MNLPELNSKSNEDTDFDDKVGLIVKNIEQNDERLKDVEEYRPN